VKNSFERKSQPDVEQYIVDRYIGLRYIHRMKFDMHVPLTPVAFHILLALADEDRHGYAIMKEVASETDGQIRLGPGTLYGAIKKLLADGLIEEADERPDPSLDDARRRYYRLTKHGARVASAEAGRLAALVKVARRKKLLSPA
jgi:DNA-binding PadR family transcriptional regulator